MDSNKDKTPAYLSCLSQIPDELKVIPLKTILFLSIDINGSILRSVFIWTILTYLTRNAILSPKNSKHVLSELKNLFLTPKNRFFWKFSSLIKKSQNVQKTFFFPSIASH